MTRRVFSWVDSLLVVGMLAYLTVGCQPREFTLTVSGEEDVEGGDVFINGKWVGTMTKEGEQAPRFVIAYPRGTLTLEVKKHGYLPFLEVIAVTSKVSEQQVHVKLVRDTISEEKKTDAALDQTPRPPAPSTSKLPICPD